MLQDRSTRVRPSCLLLPFVFLLLCILSLFITESRAAEVTLGLQGTYGEELAGYKIYYKSATSGAPYTGTGFDQGASPIIIPLESIADRSDPKVKLTGLQENKTYYMVATAYGQSGNESNFSNEVKFFADLPPQSPTGLKVAVPQAGPATIAADLTWSANPESDLAGYKIFRMDSNSNWVLVKQTGVVTNCQITDLSPGNIYSFALTAFDKTGQESPKSIPVNLDTTAYLIDSDNDGITDEYDFFPDNPNEWQDTDGDGVGDNSDAFPDDPTESADYDRDGIGDNSDSDVRIGIIIDDGDPGTSYTGTWEKSGGEDPWDPADPDATSLWGRDGETYTWTFVPEVSGNYEISMWWTAWQSRADSIPVDIKHANGTDTIFINQQINGGQWNLIGTYYFKAGISYDLTITSQPDPASTCADAVRFEKVSTTPVIIIDNDDPGTSCTGTWGVSGGGNPWDPADPAATSLWGRDGETYTWTFVAEVSGNYEISMWWTAWQSRADSIPVDIKHANGTDTVYINQQLNGGQWNGIGTYYFEGGLSYDLTITSQPYPASTCADAVRFRKVSITPVIIIDNDDPGTSYTGTWGVSGGENPWDPADPAANSLWSRDGETYTWTFVPEVSGNYEISMWWTAWQSRADNIPVDIKHANGTDTVYINQQLNGGQWNGIGTYYFEGGLSYDLTITSQPYPASTCADAVRFIMSPK